MFITKVTGTCTNRHIASLQEWWLRCSSAPLCNQCCVTSCAGVLVFLQALALLRPQWQWHPNIVYTAEQFPARFVVLAAVLMKSQDFCVLRRADWYIVTDVSNEHVSPSSGTSSPRRQNYMPKMQVLSRSVCLSWLLLFRWRTLLLAMEGRYAVCDVRTEILNITDMNLGRLVRLRRLFVSLSLVRADFDSRSLHARFAANKATGCSVTSVFPCQYHPTSSPYSSSSTFYSYQTDKRQISENPQKAMLFSFSESGQRSAFFLF